MLPLSINQFNGCTKPEKYLSQYNVAQSYTKLNISKNYTSKMLKRFSPFHSRILFNRRLFSIAPAPLNITENAARVHAISFLHSYNLKSNRQLIMTSKSNCDISIKKKIPCKHLESKQIQVVVMGINTRLNCQKISSKMTCK